MSACSATVRFWRHCGERVVSDYEREMREAAAEYERERIEQASAVKGPLVGIAIMCGFAYFVYRVMQWYVSTMPPLRFH